jgi:hypothetical protein
MAGATSSGLHLSWNTCDPTGQSCCLSSDPHGATATMPVLGSQHWRMASTQLSAGQALMFRYPGGHCQSASRQTTLVVRSGDLRQVETHSPGAKTAIEQLAPSSVLLSIAASGGPSSGAAGSALASAAEPANPALPADPPSNPLPEAPAPTEGSSERTAPHPESQTIAETTGPANSLTRTRYRGERHRRLLTLAPRVPWKIDPMVGWVASLTPDERAHFTGALGCSGVLGHRCVLA